MQDDKENHEERNANENKDDIVNVMEIFDEVKYEKANNNLILTKRKDALSFGNIPLDDENKNDMYITAEQNQIKVLFPVLIEGNHTIVGIHLADVNKSIASISCVVVNIRTMERIIILTGGLGDAEIGNK